jgi:hypothetical protein
MLAGAEAKSGVQHHDRLILAWRFFAPAWLDEQGIADLDGFEMPFPRFRPIFTPDCRERDLLEPIFSPQYLICLKPARIVCRADGKAVGFDSQ